MGRYLRNRVSAPGNGESTFSWHTIFVAIADFRLSDPIIVDNPIPVPDGPISDGMPLRIMYLGASVTRGEASLGERGYRLHIQDKLISWGNAVNAVGFNHLGEFADNQVEGYGAHRIRRIQPHAVQAIPALKPNLVLVQVGTSDCFQEDEVEKIGERMGKLTDAILRTGGKNVTVILSTLPTTPRESVEPCIIDANEQIRQVALDRFINKGRRVALAEMHHNQGLPGRPLPKDIGDDEIHPTNEGYIMMGDIFLEKIGEVADKGWLRWPVDNGIPWDGREGHEVEDEIKRRTEEEHPIPD
ncbi:SGNH hydrolase-type esterase domain-containing protein [Poronia punctata]|nr:SGNH hydrolase-type esterase domain-containing protein [Poronia punctata]